MRCVACGMWQVAGGSDQQPVVGVRIGGPGETDTHLDDARGINVKNGARVVLLVRDVHEGGVDGIAPVLVRVERVDKLLLGEDAEEGRVVAAVWERGESSARERQPTRGGHGTGCVQQMHKVRPFRVNTKIQGRWLG